MRETYLPLWIAAYMKPAKTVEPRHSSYGLKHAFESTLREVCGSKYNFYLHNGAFKGAMLHAGYRPHDPSELNWHFRCRLRKPVDARPLLVGALIAAGRIEIPADIEPHQIEQLEALESARDMYARVAREANQRREQIQGHYLSYEVFQSLMKTEQAAMKAYSEAVKDCRRVRAEIYGSDAHQSGAGHWRNGSPAR